MERDYKRDINCNKHGDRNFVFRFVYGPLMADEWKDGCNQQQAIAAVFVVIILKVATFLNIFYLILRIAN